jgi:hypothetical protein
LGRRPKVDVYGTDYPTPDGTSVRDYIHVRKRVAPLKGSEYDYVIEWGLPDAWATLGNLLIL